MKKLIVIGLLFLLCNIAEAKITTLYCTSDSWTVNTVTTYKLDSAPTNSYTGKGHSHPDWHPECILTYFDIDIVHADGSTTNIGTKVAAYDALWDYMCGGIIFENQIKAVNWDCPATTLVPTDAIRITYRFNYCDGVASETFITAQLGTTKLFASTWTITRDYIMTSYDIYEIRWGDSTYTTYISGISYEGDGYGAIY